MLGNMCVCFMFTSLQEDEKTKMLTPFPFLRIAFYGQVERNNNTQVLKIQHNTQTYNNTTTEKLYAGINAVTRGVELVFLAAPLSCNN